MTSSPPTGKTIHPEDGQATPPVVPTPPPPVVLTTPPPNVITTLPSTEGASTIMDTAQVDDNDKDPVTSKL